MALGLDERTFANETAAIALSITVRGEKEPPGFVQTETEGTRGCAALLRRLIDRMLQVPEGFLTQMV